MTLCTADFEAGTNGSNILAADPGSLTAWDSMEVVAGSAKYSNAVVGHGTLSAEFDSSVAVQVKRAIWTTALGSLTDHYIRFYAYLTDLPGSNTYIFNSSGFKVKVMTDGFVQAHHSTGFAGWFDPSGIVPDTWYRFEAHVINSETVGQIDAKLFQGESTSTIATFTSAANLNTAAATTEVSVGCTENTSGSWLLYLDDIVVGANAWIGPWQAPTTSPQVLSMQSHVFGHNMW